MSREGVLLRRFFGAGHNRSMATIHQQLTLHCPYALAKIYLERHLGPIADASQPTILTLSAPLTGRGPQPAVNVELRASLAHVPGETGQVWTITWQSPKHDAFPVFSGTVAAREGESRHSCRLEIIGDYTPPLGIVGAAFDAVLGHRIANATAAELLRSLGATIESAFELEERTKNNQTAQRSGS